MGAMKIQAAIDYFGSVENLASALGITRQAVYQWEGEEVPELRAFQLEELTDGELSK